MSDKMKVAVVGAVIAGVFAIITTIIGGIFLLSSKSANQPSVSATPPSVSIASATSQSTNLANTSSPTVQVITINQTSSCTNCFNTDLSLIVKSATIDPANSQVTLLIGFRNNSSITISPYISFLKLQDTQTGISVDGGGDGFGSIFTLTANQVVLFHPTFQFVPVAGHEYSLSAELSSQYDFSPIKIKF